MKKSFALILIISATTIALREYLAEENRPENIIETTLTSTVLGQTRELIIHLPQLYDSSARYPVLYVLDGSSQDGPLAEKLNVLSAAGHTPKTIVVGIPNMTAQNRQFQLIPPYLHIDSEKPDSPMGDAESFLKFMETELFPFMEQNYNASDVRLFAGNSRGGLLVMHSLVYKPEMFQARFCFSTPFWREENRIVSEVSTVLDSLAEGRLFLYMSVGTEETDNMKNGLAAMSKILTAHSSENITWYSEWTPNSDHQSNAHLSGVSALTKWGEYFKSY